MSSSSIEIVHDGWLIKSPPEKRLWRAIFSFTIKKTTNVEKWRRRWFVLRHSGQIPGQYLLEYYTEPTRKKLKGKIDLDQCEQVDSGLSLESRKWNYQFMFDIRTPKRIYFLVAETDTEMNKWVSCICSVCGLKIQTDEEQNPPPEMVALHLSQQSQPLPSHHEGVASDEETAEQTDSPSTSYIHMSDCFSGKTPVLNGLSGNDIPLDEAPPPPPKSHLDRSISGESYDHPRQLNPPVINNLSASYHVQEHSEKVSFIPNLPDTFNAMKDSNIRAPTVNWETYPKEVESPVLSVASSSVSSKSLLSVNSAPSTLRNTTYSENCNKEIHCQEIYQNVMMQKERRTDSEFLRHEIPPRPPKPPHLVEPGQQYQNIMNNKFLKYENVDLDTEVLPSLHHKNSINSYDIPPPQHITVNTYPVSGESQVPPALAANLRLDEMYDFPRPMQEDTLNAMPPAPPSQQKKHAYSNAPAGYMNDSVFTYDANDIRMYGESYLNMEIQKSSKRNEVYTDMSTSAYSNVPSPGVIIPCNLPPPAVNRDLKPRKHLTELPIVHSRSCSSASSTDKSAKSPSPFEIHTPPAINRDLKPKHATEVGAEKQNATILPSPSIGRIHSTKTKRSFRRTRKVQNSPGASAAQSKQSDQSSSDDEHSSSGSSRRNSSNEDQGPKFFPSSTPVQRLESEIHYLDLDLDSDIQNQKSPERPTASTVYNTVDFVKTKAFNELRQNFEMYRNSQ